MGLCGCGMIIECVNEIPRLKDRSESLMRRLLLVPFKKCFTGAERKYIKNDYLHRKEVLEYVLFKVMNMDNYELSNPTACKEMMGEFRVNNDPVAQFVECSLISSFMTCILLGIKKTARAVVHYPRRHFCATFGVCWTNPMYGIVLKLP